MAPDSFVAPDHSFLLDRTPKPQPNEPRAWRKFDGDGRTLEAARPIAREIGEGVRRAAGGASS